MSTSVYILRLEGGKFYVGRSTDVARRLAEHERGVGAAYTKKYRPVEVEAVIPNASAYDEDRYVKEYMAKYGVDNVRGGSYVTETLSDAQVEAVQVEIWNAQGACSRCGRHGHMVASCYARRDVNGCDIDTDEEVYECAYCDAEFDDELECDLHERRCGAKARKLCCFRCGREGHFVDACYARTHVDGRKIA